MVTEGRWTCPYCSKTWVRYVHSESEWRPIIRAIQEVHGKWCGKGER